MVSPSSPNSRSDSGSTPRRGRWRAAAARLAAAAIDAAVTFALAVLFAPSVGRYFATRAVVALRIGEPDTLWQGPLPLVLGIFGEVVYLMPLAALVATAAEAWSGRAAGKWLLSLRICAARGGGAKLRALTVRWLLKGSPCWLAILALLSGSATLAAAAGVSAAIVVAGSVMALAPMSRALHDRLAGTAIVRRGSQ